MNRGAFSQVVSSQTQESAEPPTIAQYDVVPLWKRVLDVTIVVLTIPFLVPLAILFSFVIKAVSPGPVLFKQQRVGFRGRPFMCLKFRTMHVNADTNLHKGHLLQLIGSRRPMTKLDVNGDPRLIPGGWILRSLGLDELPQLINVLRGEMSIVGPRPAIPYEHEQFPTDYKRRCNALPGLTGLWQVNGKNRLTFEQMKAYDLRYVDEQSFWLDLGIILRTPFAILGQVWDAKVKRANAVQGSRVSDARAEV